MKTYDLAQTVGALNDMRQTRFLIAYLLAAMCGSRRGEIAGLRGKNIDLESTVTSLDRAPD